MFGKNRIFDENADISGIALTKPTHSVPCRNKLTLRTIWGIFYQMFYSGVGNSNLNFENGSNSWDSSAAAIPLGKTVICTCNGTVVIGFHGE